MTYSAAASSSGSNQTKLLVLVKKGMEPSEVSSLIKLCRVMIEDSLGIEADISDSATWFHSEFGRCGSWESWAWETVNGKDFATRKLNFDGFIVCHTTLGRANAQIVQFALQQGRVVFFCQEGQPVGVVRAVTAHDQNNWQFGWSVRVDMLV